MIRYLAALLAVFSFVAASARAQEISFNWSFAAGGGTNSITYYLRYDEATNRVYPRVRAVMYYAGNHSVDFVATNYLSPSGRSVGWSVAGNAPLPNTTETVESEANSWLVPPGVTSITFTGTGVTGTHVLNIGAEKLDANLTVTTQQLPGTFMIGKPIIFTATSNSPAPLEFIGVTGCNVIYSSSTNNFQVTPTAESFSFTAKQDATSQFKAAQKVISASAEPYRQNYKFRLNNISDVPLPWRVVQAGEILQQGSASPRTVANIEGWTEEPGDVVLLTKVEWVFNPNIDEWIRPDGEYWEVRDTQTVEPASSDPGKLTNLPGPAGSTTGSYDPNDPPTGAGAWDTIKVSDATGELTKETYAEGIKKISENLGGEGLAAAADRLEDAASKLESSMEKMDDALTEIENLRADQPTAQQAADQGQDAAENVQSLLPSLDAAQISSPTFSPPQFAISLPPSMGGKTIDLNPFRQDRLGPFFEWFRGFVVWLTLSALLYALSSDLYEWVKTSSLIQPAKGNAVVMGTGAQATSLVVAGLISAAIALFLVQLTDHLTGQYAFTSLLSSINTNPLAGIPAGVLYMLESCLPVSTLLTCYFLRITFRLWGVKLLAGVAAVIRFFVA